MTGTGETYMLGTGRTTELARCTGSTPIFDVLADEGPFDSPLDLARWVGEFYGWRSTTPTHLGLTMDGVGWWIVEAMLMIYRDTVDRTGFGASYFDLVPSLTDLTAGCVAEWIAHALEAAGLATLPVDGTR